MATPAAYGSSRARGGIRAAAAAYTTAFGNAGSSHWAGPGIKPASHRHYVRFLTCWATRETTVWIFRELNWWVFFLCVCMCLFRATAVAYGGSQARGPIGAYTRATATPDPSRIFDLHHSSQQCRIFSPLSKARDQPHNLIVPNQIR